MVLLIWAALDRDSIHRSCWTVEEHQSQAAALARFLALKESREAAQVFLALPIRPAIRVEALDAFVDLESGQIVAPDERREER